MGLIYLFLYLRYADYAINYKRKWLFIAHSMNSITVIRARNLREWNYSQQIIFLSLFLREYVVTYLNGISFHNLNKFVW